MSRARREISARRARRKVAPTCAPRLRPYRVYRETNLIFTQDMKSGERPRLLVRAREEEMGIGGEFHRPSRTPRAHHAADSVSRISSLQAERGINQFSHVPRTSAGYQSIRREHVSAEFKWFSREMRVVFRDFLFNRRFHRQVLAIYCRTCSAGSRHLRRITRRLTASSRKKHPRVSLTRSIPPPPPAPHGWQTERHVDA